MVRNGSEWSGMVRDGSGGNGLGSAGAALTVDWCRLVQIAGAGEEYENGRAAKPAGRGCLGGVQPSHRPKAGVHGRFSLLQPSHSRPRASRASQVVKEISAVRFMSFLVFVFLRVFSQCMARQTASVDAQACPLTACLCSGEHLVRRMVFVFLFLFSLSVNRRENSPHPGPLPEGEGEA